MSLRSLNLDDTLYRYLLDHSMREHPVQRALREATAAHPRAQMQISPEQGQFMALLVKLIGARRCIEVGVFTGYSALSVALALPPDGTILACDVSEEYTAIGKPFWSRAGVEPKIDLRLAPACDTLDGCVAAGEAETYDFAFIDADKTGYDDYYERCLKLLRRGGLIAIDNVLWEGAVARPADDADTRALQALNDPKGGVMITSPESLLVLALGLIVLFALVVVAGLRFARRAQVQNLRETDATAAWMELGGPAVGKAGLLYGIWQVAMHEVVLLVRDEHDATVAKVTRRASGTAIEIGTARFTIVTTSGWSESVELVAAAGGVAAPPLCRFETRGWSGNRTARYVTPDSGDFTIPGRWIWSRQRGPSPILKDGRQIGCLGTLGGPLLDRGRALLLPASIPLAVRLFVLWQGQGVQTRSSV